MTLPQLIVNRLFGADGLAVAGEERMGNVRQLAYFPTLTVQVYRFHTKELRRQSTHCTLCEMK